MNLLSEIKRRNVHRMALLYLGAAWLIMQVVDLLIDRGPLPESLGPLVLAVLAIGFPIALILSWFYELTPGGVDRESDADAEKAITRTPGRRSDLIIISILCAAVILFAYDKWWTGPPPERSVAVLPFVNMSSDDEADWLGSGVADTVLNMLVTIPDLHVASRTSSFQPRLQGLSIPEIAGLLGVATILEGSVQRQGDRLRITAQLVNADDDNHLWSKNFDREYGDVFAVQDEIAEAVASVMQIVLREDTRQPIDREGTDNLAGRAAATGG
jgi:serine/threonine-protein kinase